jgi:hypothetical protein
MNSAEAADRERVIRNLNEAKVISDADRKVTLLAQVEEILIRRHPNTLLHDFIKHILEFHLESAPVVKKFMAGFVERVCKDAGACKF